LTLQLYCYYTTNILTCFQVTCQKQHFKVHKKNCRCINEQRVLEEDWACLSKDSTRWGLQDTAKKTIALGDLLVKAGYSESDTIAQASRYYREALKYYMLPLTKFDEYFSTFPWVEDSILLLLLVLGGDHRTVKDWSIKLGSDRLRRCYLPASDLDPEADWAVYDGDWDNDTIPLFDLAGYATDDVSFQVIQLLGIIKRLKAYHLYTNMLEAYKETVEVATIALGYTVSMEDIVNHVATYLMGDVQREEYWIDDDGTVVHDSAMNQTIEKRNLIHMLYNVMASIYYHDSKHAQTDGPTKGRSYLWNLSQGTFDKECAPVMFWAGRGNFPNYFWVERVDGSKVPLSSNGDSPPELWKILQDFFVQGDDLKTTLMIMWNLQGKDAPRGKMNANNGDSDD